uniref:Carboxylic ester hydrolase n=1 Tax=Parastrongyloides trichosuri TaxID=131310 RepID=A0A0N4ZWP1_PARTI
MGCEASHHSFDQNKNVLRKTKYGVISGKYYVTSDGFVSNIFLGIPYAEPPINENRFKKPKEIQSWVGTYKAHDFQSRCIQQDSLLQKFHYYNSKKSEDCLYLNIFTPNFELSKTIEKKNIVFPVLFLIHNGEYTSGSANQFDYKDVVDYLIRYNIIVVTMNYRIGLLGHFYTGDGSCQSNIALWDLYAALKWVKENINVFGGDDNNITVGGYSTGAIYADLLSLSPVSRNLFHKIIIMSGSATLSWSINNNNMLIEYCRNKAIELGFKKSNHNIENIWTAEDNIDMMEYLRNLPSDKFAIVNSKPGNYVLNNLHVLGPIIDGEFLTKTISQLRNEAPQKPVILGCGQNEGIFISLITGIYNPDTLMDYATKGFKKYCASKGTDFSYDQAKEMIFGKISDSLKEDKDAYTKQILKSVGNFAVLSYIIEYCIQRKESNKIFNQNINEKSSYSERDNTSDTPVYIYRFDHFKPANSYVKFKLYRYFGISNEMDFMIGYNKHSFGRKTIDNSIIKRMFTTWMTNFIKYGNPNDNTDSIWCSAYWEPAIINSEMMNLKFLKIKVKPKMGDKLCDENFLKKAKIFNLLRNIPSSQSFHNHCTISICDSIIETTYDD